MPISHITTAAQMMSNRINFQNSQSELNKRIIENSQGQKNSLTETNRPGRVLEAQASLGELGGIILDNKITQGYAQQQFAVTDRILDLMLKFVPQLDLMITPQGREDIAIQSQARQILEEMEALLNQKSGGVFLWGRDAIDTPPVSHLVSTPSHVDGTTDTSYYQGGSQDALTITDPSAPSIQEAVTMNAASNAIERTVAALVLARDGHFSEAKATGQQAVSLMGNLKEQLQTIDEALDRTDEILEAAVDTSKGMITAQLSQGLDDILNAMNETTSLEQSQLLSFNLSQASQSLLKQMMQSMTY